MPPIGRRGGDVVQHQHAAGAGLVDDDDLRAAAEVLLEKGRGHARGEIDVPTCGEADIDLDRPILGTRSEGGQREPAGEEDATRRHHQCLPAMSDKAAWLHGAAALCKCEGCVIVSFR